MHRTPGRIEITAVLTCARYTVYQYSSENIREKYRLRRICTSHFLGSCRDAIGGWHVHCTEYSAPPSTSAGTVYRVQNTPFYVRQHRVQSTVHPLLRPPAPCTEYSASPSTSASTRVQSTVHPSLRSPADNLQPR
jgi:hypothetical protein